jgi:Domain of unknown function (DUF4386)
MGILVALAGLAYLVGNLARVLLPNYGNHEGYFLLLIAIFAVPAELWLTGWLLFRGGKPKARDELPADVAGIEVAAR